MSAHNSPTKTPSRRALGELTPRAINTPSKHLQALDPLDATRARSPLKQVQTLSPHVRAGKENVSQPVALKAGRKRTIGEVDGVENAERVGILFGRAQTGLSGVLDEFNIIEDRGSSTEPDTPTREQENAMDDLHQDDSHQDNSQQSNQSFSNFVNWRECDGQSQQQSQSQLQPQPPTPPESAKKKSTKLDRLRLGLGLAMYKVKTNQVDKSGSEVMSRWETTSAVDASISATAVPTLNRSIPPPALSPARRATHIIANLDPGRPVPKLFGGPQLLPTAISSRMIYDYHLPSSPPEVTAPTCVSPEQVMSPTRSTYYTPPARRILEDDYEDEEDLPAEERLQKRREGLASSVVKGNAAKGLLELSARN